MHREERPPHTPAFVRSGRAEKAPAGYVCHRLAWNVVRSDRSLLKGQLFPEESMRLIGPGSASPGRAKPQPPGLHYSSCQQDSGELSHSEPFPVNRGKTHLSLWAHGRNCGKALEDSGHWCGLASILTAKETVTTSPAESRALGLNKPMHTC